MKYVKVIKKESIATVILNRGKVNALNGEVVDELREIFKALEAEKDIRAVIFTGHGKFFSFGFDIPEFLSFSKERFTDYLINFTDLYTYLFLYPKPLIAALNGHTIAGGCMLALACDERVMVNANARISLNEIAFGSTVFAGSTEMLRFWTGNANATRVLYSGSMYSAEEAAAIGLVHAAAAAQDMMIRAEEKAVVLSQKQLPAFTNLKYLLRKAVAEKMIEKEKDSIHAFVDIWYSEATWTNLQDIKIH